MNEPRTDQPASSSTPSLLQTCDRLVAKLNEECHDRTEETGQLCRPFIAKTDGIDIVITMFESTIWDSGNSELDDPHQEIEEYIRREAQEYLNAVKLMKIGPEPAIRVCQGAACNMRIHPGQFYLETADGLAYCANCAKITNPST